MTFKPAKSESEMAPDSIPARYALVAHVKGKQWDISINSILGDLDRWMLEIEGSLVYLHFEIPSTSIIGQLLGFLRSQREGQCRSFAVGSFGGLGVSVLDGDRGTDSCTILIGEGSGSILRLSISGNDFNSLVDVLQELATGEF